VQGYHARFEDVVEPYFLIVFKDGAEWRTHRGSGGSEFQRDKAIVDWVSLQCSQPIREVAFVEDVPR
jgi:hypothetical protein